MAAGVFFDEAEREPEPRLLLPSAWPRVRRDFAAWVEELLSHPSPQR